MLGTAQFDTPDPSGAGSVGSPAGAGPDTSAISNYYEGQLGSDTAALADLGKQEQQSAPQFTEKPPERQPGITGVAPLLIGLAALGGKAAGLHATTMLGATNGMVEGLIKGNEQKYRDQKASYDAAYQQYRDKWDQQNKIYNEMRQVYKGRVDADLRALQFARQVTGDNAKVTQNDVKNHQQAIVIDDKLRNTDMRQAHNQAEEHIQLRKLEMEKEKIAQEAGSPENAALAAALADKGVDIKGYRGKQLQLVLTGLIAKHPTMTNDEIADHVKSGQIDMRVATTEATKLSAREASIAPVEKSINQPGGFLDQAEKAVNDIGLPNSKIGAEVEYRAMEQRGDPKLSAYKTRVAELRAEYSIVLAKGGATSVHSQEEAAKVVPDIISPAQFKEVKKAIFQGIETAKKGVRESITDIGGTKPESATPTAPQKQVTRTGVDSATGRKVIQYSDGSVAFAD